MSLIFEFALLGLVLAGLFFGFRALTRRLPDNRAYRWGVGLAIAGMFLLFWVNGAVGIIGSENNDANMLYFGIILIGVLGSSVVRARPAGMVWVAATMAGAMILISVVALVGGWGVSGPIWPNDVLFITAFFAAIWGGSAFCFKQATTTIGGNEGGA